MAHIEAALASHRAALGDDHPYTLSSLNGYALVLVSQGRAKEAEPLSKDALERNARVLGPDHPDTLQLLNNYAGVLDSLGRATEAEGFARRAYESALANPSMGRSHSNTQELAATLAHCLDSLGRKDEARELRKPSTELATTAPESPRSLATAPAKSMDPDSAVALLREGKFLDAEKSLQRLLTAQEKLDAESWTTFELCSLIGAARVGQRNYVDAARNLEERGAKPPFTGCLGGGREAE